jgi:chemotaxis protein histidine kinase CheA
MINEFENPLDADAQFAKRMAEIRARFATRLGKQIRETDEAVPLMRGDGGDAVATVEAAYRRFHDICGMASTVGFTVTGRAAKELDAILVVAFRAQRGLTEAELTNARTGLDAVKAAATIEIPFFDQESST